MDWLSNREIFDLFTMPDFSGWRDDLPEGWANITMPDDWENVDKDDIIVMLKSMEGMEMPFIGELPDISYLINDTAREEMNQQNIEDLMKWVSEQLQGQDIMGLWTIPMDFNIEVFDIPQSLSEMTQTIIDADPDQVATDMVEAMKYIVEEATNAVREMPTDLGQTMRDLATDAKAEVDSIMSDLQQFVDDTLPNDILGEIESQIQSQVDETLKQYDIYVFMT